MDERPSPAAAPRSSGADASQVVGGGLVDLALVLGIALVVAVVATVVFGPQLAAILDFIGAQVQQPGA